MTPPKEPPFGSAWRFNDPARKDAVVYIALCRGREFDSGRRYEWVFLAVGTSGYWNIVGTNLTWMGALGKVLPGWAPA